MDRRRGLDSDGELLFTHSEIEFTAEEEIMEIIPNFQGDRMHMMDGTTCGPFRPQLKTKVPLWMAIHLQKHKKCTVVPPEWMELVALATALEDERKDASVFQPLPFHYIEISQMLFRDARDSWEGDGTLYKVRTLVEDIRAVRWTKIRNGVKRVSQSMTIQLNNLSAMEINLLRSFFTKTLDHFHQTDTAKVDPAFAGAGGAAVPPVGAGGGAGDAGRAPRQLRRAAAAV